MTHRQFAPAEIQPRKFVFSRENETTIKNILAKYPEGRTASEALPIELQEHVKTNLAVYKYPREIAYVGSFELTSSGKISRKKLREQEAEKKLRKD